MGGAGVHAGTLIFLPGMVAALHRDSRLQGERGEAHFLDGGRDDVSFGGGVRTERERDGVCAA